MPYGVKGLGLGVPQMRANKKENQMDKKTEYERSTWIIGKANYQGDQTALLVMDGILGSS